MVLGRNDHILHSAGRSCWCVGLMLAFQLDLVPFGSVGTSHWISDAYSCIFMSSSALVFPADAAPGDSHLGVYKPQSKGPLHLST